MNVVDLDHGLIGCFGIVGGSIAAATGVALALRGRARIAVAYFGDGTTNQAYFFECLNFAKVFSLPLIFVCENNGYGEYTPMAAVTAGEIISRADGDGDPGARSSTEWTSRRPARPRWRSSRRCAAAAARSFVEARTYRFVGHSRSDPGRYRPEGELDRWRERDPLDARAGMASRAPRRRRAAHRGGRRLASRSEMAAIEASALAAPFPTPAAVTEFK